MKRDLRYDYIRVFSMILIVLCHWQQIIQNYSVAFWLNVGVQIFFVISAKLLSRKSFNSKADVLKFYKSRYFRICLPLWIYLLCITPALCVIGRAPKIISAVMYFIGLSGFAPTVVLGLGHLWYISVLLICYSIVPLLNLISVRADAMSKGKGVLLKSILPLFFAVAFLFIDSKEFFGVNISLFCIAYFCFKKAPRDTGWAKMGTKCLLAPAICGVIIRVVLDMTPIKDNVYYDALVVTSVKAILGAFLFCLLFLLFSKKQKEGKNCVLRFLSDISYEVYIVHQFIILAFYEFVPFFKNGVSGGVLLLLCSAVAVLINAIILYYMKIFVEKRILKK